MKRLMILALAASLLPCASFAQTPMLTLASPLKANSGDQNIKLSTARAPFKKGAVIKLCPVGIYRPRYNDAILQGRATEGFILIINGKRYANAQLNGFTQIAGKFVDPFTWQGSVAGIDIVQRARIEGDKLTFEVTPTNMTANPVTMIYARIADPDQSSDNAGGPENFTTTNTAMIGGVESGLFGGGTFFMRDLAGTATVRTALYNKAVDLGTVLAPGKTIKGDYVVQLVFAPVTLVPGQPVTHSFDIGVR